MAAPGGQWGGRGQCESQRRLGLLGLGLLGLDLLGLDLLRRGWLGLGLIGMGLLPRRGGEMASVEERRANASSPGGGDNKLGELAMRGQLGGGGRGPATSFRP